MAVAKTAISLPPELLRLIDAAAAAQGVSRSEFIRRVTTDFFARRELAEKVETYIAGYERDPEAGDDIEATLALALPGLATEGWDEAG